MRQKTKWLELVPEWLKPVAVGYVVVTVMATLLGVWLLVAGERRGGYIILGFNLAMVTLVVLAFVVRRRFGRMDEWFR